MQEASCSSSSLVLVVSALLVVATLLVPRKAVGLEQEGGEMQVLDVLSPYQGRQLNEIAFPLGGIGTGSVSLGGRGRTDPRHRLPRPEGCFRPQAWSDGREGA